jgi:hypothetical protein
MQKLITSDSELRAMSQGGKHMDEKEKGAPDKIQSLLTWNDLNYTVSRVNSLVSMRNIKEYYATQQSYVSDSSGSGVDIVFNMQTGAQYINTRNSMLVFDLTFTADTATETHFGIGSAFNIIREVTITSKTGTELDRYQSANVHRAHHDRLFESAEWTASVGKLMGYGDDTDTVAVGTAVRYLIPLAKLSPIFANDKMMHNYLASGMRIELKLDRATNAAVADADDSTIKFTVTDPKLLIDSHLLNDGASDALEKISTNSGLEYSWSAVYTESDAGTSNRFNIEVNRAVGRAMGLFCVSRLVANLNKSDADSLASEVITTGADGEIKSFQVRLGSLYFPNKEIKNPRELYYNTLYAGHKLEQGHQHPSQLTYGDFETGGLAQLHSTMETNSILNYSGSSVNNSRSVSVAVEFGAGIASTGRQIDCFMAYMSVVRSYRNNCVVSS